VSALLCALALAAPSSGVAKGGGPGFKPGTYTGRTSQGLPVTISVSGNRVLTFAFGWRAKCDDGKVHVNTISAGGGKIRHRHFSYGGVHVLNTGGSFHVRGKLRGGSAWGKLSRSGPSAFNTNCLARGVKWHARFRRGKNTSSPYVGNPTASATTYIGATSQGLPITLSAGATDVLSVQFGWSADCADGQTHVNTISGGSGPLTNGGFSIGGTLNTGGHFQVDGTIAGNTASGTLGRGGPHSFGTFDCNISGVTWQARAIG
jgi:hypothetical protein